MASVNKAILIGNLGKDPDVRVTPSGKKVASFSMATQDGFGDNQTTDWHNIVLWEKLAETAEAYLTRGAPVYIEGRIKARSYEKDGETKWVTEIIAERMQLLGKKADAPAAEEPVAKPTRSRKAKVQPEPEDDELPF